MSQRTSRFQVQFDVGGDGEVRASLKSIRDEVKTTAEEVEKSGRNWEDYGKKIGTAMAYAGTAAVAGIALILRNTVEAERELAQLGAVLRSTGQDATYSRDQLVSMAEGIAAASTFSAGEIVKAETRLLSYSGIASKNFPAALQIAIDQAARLGMGVEQSAETIGRALESPQKAAAALAQQGFGAAFTDSVRKAIKELDEAGKTAEAQQIILDILADSYGGAAQAARDTFGGALQALGNTLMDVTTGSDGSLQGATVAVNDLIATLNDPAVRQGFDAIATGVANVTSEVVRGIAEFAKYLALQREVANLSSGKTAPAQAGTEALRERLANAQAERAYSASMTTSVLGVRIPGRANSIDADRARLDAEIARLQRELSARGPQFSDTAALPASMLRPVARDAAPAGGGGGVTGGGDGKKTRAAQLTETEKAAKQLNTEYGRMLERLQQEVTLNGQTTELARVNYQIKQDGLDALNPKLAEQLRLAAEERDAQERSNQAKEEGARVTEAMLTPQEVLSAEIARYKALLDAGAISQETYNRAVGSAEKDYKRATESARKHGATVKEILQDASDSTQYLLGDSIYDALSGNFERIEDRWQQMLLQMVADIAASKITEWANSIGNNSGGSSGGSGGGWWATIAQAVGSYFGGGRATGGSTQGGKLYEIGELGKPEIFEQNGRRFMVSGAGGNVVPAQYAAAGGMAGGGAAFKFDMNFNFITGESSEEESGEGTDEARQLGALVKATVRDTMANEMRPGGLLWKMQNG